MIIHFIPYYFKYFKPCTESNLPTQYTQSYLCRELQWIYLKNHGDHLPWDGIKREKIVLGIIHGKATMKFIHPNLEI